MRTLALLAALALAAPAQAQVVPVTLDHQGDAWRLLRGGQPYFVKGGGGWAHLDTLAESGGNSFRLWGADDADRHLDAAQKLNLTVCVGLWLGHERHGFNYNSAEQVATLIEDCKKHVQRLKDHPAVLMWGVGNEMEAEHPDNAAIWLAVNAVAHEIKKIDPNHPTIVVVAEIGGNKIKNINRLCPDIDLIGINAYGGVGTIPQRYRDAGGTKPYILTEYGPRGHWECPHTDWNASFEPTSTEKAAAYATAYRQAVLAEPKLCLGSYAFTWGHKQEATTTWFGLFLPDGARTAGVDELRQFWTGKPAPNRCPTIDSLALVEGDRTKPGATIHAKLAAADPEHDPLTVTWTLMEEQPKYAAGGDATPPLRTFPDAIVESSASGATIRIPAEAIAYRLYAFVHDDHGGGASANVPLLASIPKPKSAGHVNALPYVLYGDDAKDPAFAPTGWMGSTAAMKLDQKCHDRPKSGDTCMRFQFSAADGWGAIAFQSPADDWGDKPGGLDLSGASKLTLWARGSAGGEKVDFKVGLINADKPYPDSAKAVTPAVLTTDWVKYTIDLAGKDLSQIKTGFVLSLAGQGKPITIDLDDIRFEP